MGADLDVTPSPGRKASDGSPYPDRSDPSFERDVRAMFAHIARGYDWFDHVASLGNDLFWRPRALWDVDRFRDGRIPRSILDVGCGPGDLSILASHHFPGSRVVGVDVTPAMLSRARARRVPAADGRRLHWGEATALRLPFRTGTFDLVMSAFVVRNLPRLPDAFSELRRVVAPGGTLLTLEITEPAAAWFGSLFHAYFDTFVPWLGAAVGSEGPYRYLPESLRTLPARSAMLALLHRAGFDRVETRPQSLGIVTSYLAQAPDGAGDRSGSTAEDAPIVVR
ncbi:MAG: ubiquinone/menaquinone biosynthesis methyltransferase [Thermoplasmata archaeon]|nr:ubiquinone/menaquinone biosynthesis methyltransferase [Thermoplasmata archaeon]